MPVAIKKDVTPSENEGTPQTFEEALSDSIQKLEKALQSLPPEQLEKAKKEASHLLNGDLSWADLAQYTPERLFKIAEMGYEQFRLGQYDRAERLFKGITVIDPGNYYYHQMLGAVFQRKDLFAEAVVEYSLAIDLEPKDIVSLTNRGEIYFKLGLFDLAKADFDRAIDLDPKEENKWSNRARMLREQVKLVKKRKK